MIDIPFSPWERFRTNVCSSFFFFASHQYLDHEGGDDDIDDPAGFRLL